MAKKKSGIKDFATALFCTVVIIGCIVLATGVAAAIAAHFVEKGKVEIISAIELFAYTIAGSHPPLWCLAGGSMVVVGIVGIVATE